MARFCQSQLGSCHVHFPLVSRDSHVESEKQHGLHVRYSSITCRFVRANHGAATRTAIVGTLSVTF